MQTEERTWVCDITKFVRDAVQQSPVTAGMVLVNTMHTTCALLIDEHRTALVDNLMSMIERLVPERSGDHHNERRYADCERGNADSHLRAALLGSSVAVWINDGDLTLGRFQSIIFAELDGPRKREIRIQVIGE